MRAQWTGEIFGKMHIYGITAKQLAKRLGMNPKYVSVILNGHREPAGAEQKFKAALEEIIALKESAS